MATDGDDDTTNCVRRRPSFQVFRNTSNTKQLVQILNREGSAEASHVNVTGSELLGTISRVIGGKHSKKTAKDGEARTLYLAQGMTRTS